MIRLLEVSSKIHGAKAELSKKTMLGLHVWSKSELEKIRVVAQGGARGLSSWSELKGSLLR